MESNNNSEKSVGIDGLDSGIQGPSEEDAPTVRSDSASFDSDLDLLSEHLASLEGRASAPQGGPSTTVRIDPSDITELSRQIGTQIKAELDAGFADSPNPSPGGGPGLPDSSRHPRVIKDHWTSAEDEESHDLQNGGAEASGEKANPDRTSRKCKKALDRLRQHEAESEQRIAELSRQIEQEQGRQHVLRENLDREKAELQEAHQKKLIRLMEVIHGNEKDQVDPPAAERRSSGLDRKDQDALDKLSAEKDARLQSARTRAYALHASGKYDEALQAYQNYFDLLGSASDDVSALQASRECTLLAEHARNRTRRKWALSLFAVMLFGFWVGCSIYIANRTVEGARSAMGNADMEGLRAYCNRLESTFLNMGSLGMVGYLYGPEIGSWKGRIEGAAQEQPDMRLVITDTNPPPEMTDGSVAAGSAGIEYIGSFDNYAPVVVTNYLTPPIASFGFAPRGTEAVVYNSDFEKMAMDHSISVLKPGERYLLLASRRGHEPYMEPFAADWQGVKRIDVSLTNVRRNDRKGSTPDADVSADGVISMDEIFGLMEQFESRILRQRLRELRASLRELEGE